jgi:hypothetical protein
VKSPFALLGNDERALTFALGYTFSQSPDFLQGFLRAIGIGGLFRKTLAKARIDMEHQRKDSKGITDVEIRLPNLLHVIIEAKVGLSLPTREQVLNYTNRLLETRASRKRLVILVAQPADFAVHKILKRGHKGADFLTGLEWSTLLDLAVRLRDHRDLDTDSRFWLDAFTKFLEDGYQMRSFTHEVWIAPASIKPLWPGGMSFHDTHVKHHIYYWDKLHRATRPLYIAFRCRGKVEGFQRVLRVEHDRPPIDYISTLKNVPDDWPSRPFTIWHLGDLVKFSKPIPTGDPKMWASHIYCDMDILLSSSTVKEAAERMKLRNKAKAS